MAFYCESGKRQNVVLDSEISVSCCQVHFEQTGAMFNSHQLVTRRSLFNENLLLKQEHECLTDFEFSGSFEDRVNLLVLLTLV